MLTDEHVFEINEFFNGPAWGELYARIQSACIAEWLGSHDPADREECWRQMQAVMTLHAALKNAPATKQMDQRNQQRRYQT
jgi:hypothetical protein